MKRFYGEAFNNKGTMIFMIVVKAVDFDQAEILLKKIIRDVVDYSGTLLIDTHHIDMRECDAWENINLIV